MFKDGVGFPYCDILHRNPERKSPLVGKIEPIRFILVPGCLNVGVRALGDDHVEVEVHVVTHEMPEDGWKIHMVFKWVRIALCFAI